MQMLSPTNNRSARLPVCYGTLPPYLSIPLFAHACDKIVCGGDSRGAKDAFH